MTNPGKNHATGRPPTEARLNGQNDKASAEDQIRMRAYELYLERGQQPSDGVGDWLQAERELHGQS